MGNTGGNGLGAADFERGGRERVRALVAVAGDVCSRAPQHETEDSEEADARENGHDRASNG